MFFVGKLLLRAVCVVAAVAAFAFLGFICSLPQGAPAPTPDTVLAENDNGAVVVLDEGAWLIIKLPGKQGGRWDEIDRDGGGAVCRMCKLADFQDEFIPSSAADGTGFFEIRYRGWVSRDGKGISKEQGQKQPVKVTLGYRSSKDEKPTSTFTFTATVYTKRR